MARILVPVLGAATLAMFVVLISPATAQPAKSVDTPDIGIRGAAPQVLKALRERKYENVGVLKFLVADSDGVLRDNVGPLNRTLAGRLEVALALLLDEDDKL